ncbi:DUF1439 domain-containing protein [Alkalimarinus sediminis]|uniref:DUF1439 domain-containing protein n=1 Tax=Alkalimarinus sediminis TaxID=1632866 RepID=A0A9E8HLZ4_9ALTE|nr:DUF1439 domain-containing protein [Alkalimarinus sediminis]UZW75123.1 DUF1439 domain-containing protein [Alkalimarinus sediminis]
MSMFSTVHHRLTTLRGAGVALLRHFSILLKSIAIIFGAIVLLGCNEKQQTSLFLKESEIQAGVKAQMPISGLVSVQIHIPDEVASLSGFFAERVVSDPIVEARIELDEVDVSLKSGEAQTAGHLVLLAEPIIRTNLLGIDIAEPLNIELSGQLQLTDQKLYFEPQSLKENGSFFLNNFVPDEYRSQFIENVNDWFVAYFSAYPLYQFTPDSRLTATEIDATTPVIEDDLVRFLP